ncbi:MAG: TetR family transcriptional regulator C-terminal domain-containing protein [Desulfovibrionaceae bacterium]
MNNETREHILNVAADIIHGKGFNNTGLREILEVAQIPKGSFYYYFPNKEALGIAVARHLAERMGTAARSILFAENGTPLSRLREFFVWCHDRFAEQGYSRGCPIGNLSQEMADLSPQFRETLQELHERFIGVIALVLEQARIQGELSEQLDPQEAARFMFASWEGAIMRMKVTKNREPLDIFVRISFELLLVP